MKSYGDRQLAKERGPVVLKCLPDSSNYRELSYSLTVFNSKIAGSYSSRLVPNFNGQGRVSLLFKKNQRTMQTTMAMK